LAIAFSIVGSRRELLRHRRERRAAAKLFDDAIGAALALVRTVGAIHWDEDLADTGLGLADVGPHPCQGVIHLGLGDIDLGAHPAADDLVPGNLGLDLLRRDFRSDSNALEVLPELPAPHAGGALDFGDAPLNFTIGRFDAEPLGILDLQALVDHLAQDLRGHPLAEVRAVRQAARLDGEEHALLQVEVSDGVVVDAGNHAQALAGLCGRSGSRRPLGRCRGGQEQKRDRYERAEDGRGHFTDGLREGHLLYSVASLLQCTD
jgi:hypothetical protein